MKRVIIIITYLCLVLVGTALSQTVEWQGIILLRSTRNDVEQILGAPKDKEINLYETTKEKIVVWYSKGTCKKDKSAVWNVPKDTVLGILVSPKEELNATVVKEKLNQKFEKQADWEIQNVYIYYNNDNSIKFETRLLPNGIEDVVFVAYSPGKSGGNLLCKSPK